MDSLQFLGQIAKSQPQPIYVLFGDEDFLKREALTAIRRHLVGDDPDPLAYTALPGEQAKFAAVVDELSTLPFLCPRRLVVIEDADKFVTESRPKLEKYVTAPAATGTLVLVVKTWAANTKLAKLVPAEGTVECRTLAAAKLPDWCVRRAKTAHGKPINPSAAELLVDLVGGDMGLLDQELAKLAAYAAGAKEIGRGDVDRCVGRSRTEEVWKIFDAIAARQTTQALGTLSRLFEQGQDPMAVLGAFSWRLRALAQVHRALQAGRPMAQALSEAKLPPHRGSQESAERQMRHLGERRLEQVYDLLLEVDQGMKGYNALPPRTQMERLVVQLAAPAARSGR
jgi:DNA polymerase-3 subunit delta